ncbi:hypothetical protein RYX36_008853, partial [Vicia faba]
KLRISKLEIFAKYSNKTCKHTLANVGELNYPTKSIVFPEKTIGSASTFNRTVTNVGPAMSKYHVIVMPFKGVEVKAEVG